MTLKDVIIVISANERGICFILEEDKLVGVVTDGDVRRAYTNNVPFSQNISQIMIEDPIKISEKLSEYEIPSEVRKQIKLNERHSSKWVRHILVINEKNQLVNVLDYFCLSNK